MIVIAVVIIIAIVMATVIVPINATMNIFKMGDPCWGVFQVLLRGPAPEINLASLQMAWPSKDRLCTRRLGVGKLRAIHSPNTRPRPWLYIKTECLEVG